MGTDGDIAAALGETFDPNAHEAATDFELIPVAWYPVMIDYAEVKTTNDKLGAYLEMELTIIGEVLAGRKLWARITLINVNEKAVEIGQRELAAVGQALGLPAITDSSDLKDGTLMVKTKIRPAVTAEKSRDGKPHEASNDVGAYKAIDGAAPAKPETAPVAAPAQTAAAAAPATKPAPAATGGKRPWEK